jgi:hypothetical protein
LAQSFNHVSAVANRKQCEARLPQFLYDYISGESGVRDMLAARANDLTEALSIFAKSAWDLASARS